MVELSLLKTSNALSGVVPYGETASTCNDIKQFEDANLQPP